MTYYEPYIQIPEDIIPKMLSLASVKPDELVIDLGSGDGRIVIIAARDFRARAMGIELRRSLVRTVRRRLKEMGLSHRIAISRRNFKKVSLRKADVIATYLSSYTLNLLAPKFIRELRHGARIVNFDYPIPGWKSTSEVEVIPSGWKKPHPVYLYVM